MRSFLVLLCCICLLSCSSESNEQISDFKKEAEAFEKKANEGNIQKNADELEKMSDHIGQLIIELSRQEFTDKQQQEVDEISLQYQITLITVQDQLHSTGHKQNQHN